MEGDCISSFDRQLLQFVWGINNTATPAACMSSMQDVGGGGRCLPMPPVPSRTASIAWRGYRVAPSPVGRT